MASAMRACFVLSIVSSLPCYGLLLPPALSSLACGEPAQQIFRRIGAQFKIILDDRLRRGAVAVALPCFSPLARRGRGRLPLRQAPRRAPQSHDRIACRLAQGERLFADPPEGCPCLRRLIAFDRPRRVRGLRPGRFRRRVRAVPRRSRA